MKVVKRTTRKSNDNIIIFDNVIRQNKLVQTLK